MMEAVLILTLFFLTCSSLSGAETSLNLSENPQPCLSDIHAALRDMSNKLGEYNIKMEKLSFLDTLAKEQKTEMDTVKQQLHDVQSILQAQAAELMNLDKKSNVTENRVDALMKDRQVGQVAFSAALLSSGAGKLGPYNTNVPLVFRYVVSNIGNAYNHNTGFFTAPVGGAYHFQLYIGAWSDEYFQSSAVLEKNGARVVTAIERANGGHSNAANAATLILNAGDVVCVRLVKNTVIHDNQNHYSTFSGFLLYPM
ncbi:hypothetical protein WMY93_026997 [Mugilogobius chulae]|uniref:C1q domain-containing protein n=1 Tax=Mugilogobius chulae TaxID=88201 RepID=A0AAW0MYG8_9GOBI